MEDERPEDEVVFAWLERDRMDLTVFFLNSCFFIDGLDLTLLLFPMLFPMLWRRMTKLKYSCICFMMASMDCLKSFESNLGINADIMVFKVVFVYFSSTALNSCTDSLDLS